MLPTSSSQDLACRMSDCLVFLALSRGMRAAGKAVTLTSAIPLLAPWCHRLPDLSRASRLHGCPCAALIYSIALALGNITRSDSWPDQSGEGAVYPHVGKDLLGLQQCKGLGLSPSD